MESSGHASWEGERKEAVNKKNSQNKIWPILVTFSQVSALYSSFSDQPPPSQLFNQLLFDMRSRLHLVVLLLVLTMLATICQAEMDFQSSMVGRIKRCGYGGCGGGYGGGSYGGGCCACGQCGGGGNFGGPSYGQCGSCGGGCQSCGGGYGPFGVGGVGLLQGVLFGGR